MSLYRRAVMAAGVAVLGIAVPGSVAAHEATSDVAVTGMVARQESEPGSLHAVVAAGNAWAVGHSRTGQRVVPLSEHWDRVAWTKWTG